MNPIASFLSTVYGRISSAAAAVAMIWGLCKGIGAFRAWMTKRIEQRKQEKEFPAKVYAAIQEIKVDLDDTRRQLRLVSDRMNDNDDATATLMLDKMMQSYHKYVLQKQEIPLDKRTSMCVMHEQYKKNPCHNHVPEDFVEQIKQCKVEGSK